VNAEVFPLDGNIEILMRKHTLIVVSLGILLINLISIIFREEDICRDSLIQKMLFS
jgi:hypothetical protein